MRRRCWWGWGYEGEGLTDDEVVGLGALLGERFGLDGTLRTAPAPADLEMSRPRIEAPTALAVMCSDSPTERAAHSYGKSYGDVVRALQGRIDHPPDVVARPRDEADVVSILDWCSEARVAAIPYGGGSSVVGGVEPDVGDGYRAAVSIDLSALDRLLDLDPVSQAARFEAGVLGPALEAHLRPHGLTLRHFPQSFECSSLGGWVTTRAGGHFATGPTHIDDLVEALRVVTPAGVVETRRLPGSGAGPSPDRLFLGSEGALGIVTEAWVKLRRRPRWRAGGTATFAAWSDAVAAARAMAQSGLGPSNCRLIDPMEALVNGAGDGSATVLIIGFESADHPLGPWAERAAELVADHGGHIERSGWRLGNEEAAGAGGGAGAWRSSFLRAPYRRDALVRLGALCETFETACTWDRFDSLHEQVTSAVHHALAEVGSSAGFVTCRFTHLYSDGPAPYFTVIAPARAGAELEQWAVVKEAASEAILASGGTITHHHAVGRDHRPWYDRQRPSLFAEVLAAAKARLDPAGICNPGVLLDPPLPLAGTGGA